jgi:hypothetical protein
MSGNLFFMKIGIRVLMPFDRAAKRNGMTAIGPPRLMRRSACAILITRKQSNYKSEDIHYDGD